MVRIALTVLVIASSNSHLYAQWEGKEKLLEAHEAGEPPWKLLFDEIGSYFDERFGSDWQEKDKSFWIEFERINQISKGIQERIKHDKKIIDKGI